MPERRPTEPADPARPAGAARSALDVARLATVPPRVLIGLMALLAALVLFAELPGRPLILHVLQKLAHPAVIGAIALGLLGVEYQRDPATRPLPNQYLRAFALATSIGALTELGQLFTHRDPSLRDIWFDARGAACALAFAMTFDARWRPVLTGAWRAGCALAGGALAALILTPLMWTAAGYAERSVRHPALFTPNSNLDLLFVGLTASAPELAHPPTSIARSGQELALRVPLQARPYAGLTLDEPSPDWRGHERLVIEVGNAGRSDLSLRLRVHDRTHDWTASDRFNGELRVAAGQRTTFSFPLTQIAAGPRGRPLDLGHVAGLALYRVGLEGPRDFWLFRIALQDAQPTPVPATDR